MKTLVLGLPNVDDYPQEFITSLLNICGSLASLGIQFLPVFENGVQIDTARNRIFKKAQELDADYLMFIDSDMVFPSESLHKLIGLDKDIATGVYFSKQAPHRPVVYNWTGRAVGVHKNYADIPKEVFKVDSCGAGFLLIGRRVLEEWDTERYRTIGRPFTRIPADYGDTGEDSLGEDTSFCLRCKDIGYEIWADPTFVLGHRGPITITSRYWEQALINIRNSEKQEGVDGWTTEEEHAFLAERAVNASEIVEIGCWKGRSTKVLLDASDGFVHAVDHFKGTSKEGDGWSGFLADEQDIYGEFMKNVGDYTNLRVHKMGSDDAAELFSDNSLDLVFIDGDHTYDQVISDIDNYLPKIKKGGTICGHDYNPGFPDVIRAVTERFGKVDVVGTIWYKEVA
jgi:hypothetical protein